MVMRKLRKVVALMLSLAMVLTAMPVSAANFTDTKGHWAEASINRWVDAGILNGRSATTFAPEENILRGELAKVLSEVLGLTEPSDAKFADVEGHWAKDYILRCNKAGIINGYDNGLFGPEDFVTREDAVTMIARAFLKVAADPEDDSTGYKDDNLVAAYAKKAFAKLIAYNVLNGYGDGTIRPDSNILRGEIAKLLDCLVGVYVDKKGEVSTTAYKEGTQQAPVVVVNDKYKEKEDVQVELVEAADGSTVVAVTVPGIEETISVPVDPKVQEPVYVQNSTIEEGAEVIKPSEPEEPKCDGNHEFPKTTNCAAGYTPTVECPICGTVEDDYVKATTHTFGEDGICTECGMNNEVTEEAENSAMKFYAKIDSSAEEGDTTPYTGAVEALVTNDYVAKLTLKPGEVNAGLVNVIVSMRDVASLDVDEFKSEAKQFATGLDATPVIGADSTWTPNMFAFKSGRINATIVDDAGSKSTTYDLAGTQLEDGSTVITATPAEKDVEGTRAAWQKMTEGHIVTSEQTTPDSSIVIANGSYMILGNDKLCFEKGLAENDKDLVLDGFSTEEGVSDLETTIRDKVQLITDDSFVSKEYEAKFYLAAGTKLAVSSSVATLADNCEITVSGLDATKFDDILPQLQAATTGSDMVQKLVLLLDEMVGSIDGGSAVNVTMTFTKPEVKDTKFELSMSAANADGNGETKVSMEVFDDYSLEINLPMKKLNASQVKLAVMMKDVASLGITEAKTHVLPIDTKLEGVDGDLNTYMYNAPEFKTSTIYVTVNNTQKCTYTLTSDMDKDWVTVTGTVNEDDARDVWHAIVNDENIASGDNLGEDGALLDDSFVVIDSDSYLKVGTEKLAFEVEDDLVLDNFDELGALKETIKNAVVLTSDTDEGIVLFAGAGTELAVSSSKATLLKDCTIKISGVELEGTPLKDLQTASNGDTKALIQELFFLLNDVVGAMNGATVNVEITI